MAELLAAETDAIPPSHRTCHRRPACRERRESVRTTHCRCSIPLPTDNDTCDRPILPMAIVHVSIGFTDGFPETEGFLGRRHSPTGLLGPARLSTSRNPRSAEHIKQLENELGCNACFDVASSPCSRTDHGTAISAGDPDCGPAACGGGEAVSLDYAVSGVP